LRQKAFGAACDRSLDWQGQDPLLSVEPSRRPAAPAHRRVDSAL